MTTNLVRLATLLVVLPSTLSSALPSTFSSSAPGRVSISGDQPGGFPLSYRRTFSTKEQFLQFCIDNLNASPAYDSSGALVGVSGTVTVRGYPSYYVYARGTLQEVYVEDPILEFLGGRSGTVVVGAQLWNLRARSPAEAITSLPPSGPPAEEAYQILTPGQFAAMAATHPVAAVYSRGPSVGLTSKAPAAKRSTLSPSLTSGGTCRGAPPRCTTASGQPGHQTCDLDTETWTGGCKADGPPPVTQVWTAAPTSITAPLGTTATFQGWVNEPRLPAENKGVWTTLFGTGALTQDTTQISCYGCPGSTSVTFYPYDLGWSGLLFTSTWDPSRMSAAVVFVPEGTPFVDNGKYPDVFNHCVDGDGGRRACMRGQTYSNDFYVYSDKGARTDYVACGADTYPSPGLPAWDYGGPCVYPRHPGPNVGLQLFVRFYGRPPFAGPNENRHKSPSLEVLKDGEPVEGWNTSHIQYSIYNLFGFPNDDISIGDVYGVCATHGATGRLDGRTGQDDYVAFCDFIDPNFYR